MDDLRAQIERLAAERQAVKAQEDAERPAKVARAAEGRARWVALQAGTAAAIRESASDAAATIAANCRLPHEDKAPWILYWRRHFTEASYNTREESLISSATLWHSGVALGSDGVLRRFRGDGLLTSGRDVTVYEDSLPDDALLTIGSIVDSKAVEDQPALLKWQQILVDFASSKIAGTEFRPREIRQD